MAKDKEKSKRKSNAGRPPKQIDYKRLDSMCAIQCTGEECAAILDMSYLLMNQKLKEDGHGNFLEYYAIKAAGGKASLRRRQYKAAMDGQPTMLVWLGKQWLGQTDKSDYSVHGPGGGPIKTENKNWTINVVKPDAKPTDT